VYIVSCAIDCALGSKFESSICNNSISWTSTTVRKMITMQCLRLLGEYEAFSNIYITVCNIIHIDYYWILFTFTANNVPRSVYTASNVSRHIASLSMLPDTHQMLYKTCRYYCSIIQATNYICVLCIDIINLVK